MINAAEENNRIKDSVSKEPTQTKQESPSEEIEEVFNMPKPLQDFISAIYKENNATTYALKLTEQEYKPEFNILHLFFRFRRIGYIPQSAFNYKDTIRLVGIATDKPYGQTSRIDLTYYYHEETTTK